MLIIILIDVQFLQNVVFSFEKGANGQNLSCLSPHHSKNLPAKYLLLQNAHIYKSVVDVWQIILKKSVRDLALLET